MKERMLVAVGNANQRRHIARLLSQSYGVTTAATGTDLLAAAREKPFDLVLADVPLPEMDGFNLMRALRADSATRQLPVVLMSTRGGDEIRKKLLEAGANDYLVKPFSDRQLLARVSAQFALMHLQSSTGHDQRADSDDGEAERTRLHELFMQAPAAICLLSGPSHVFTLTNPRYLELIGHRESVLGRSVHDVFPELVDQGILELLDLVYQTGESIVGDEMLVQLDRDRDSAPEEIYFNFVYAPLRAPGGEIEGIFVHAYEITEQVRARQQLEAEMAERIRAESLLAGERGILELIARGVPLAQTLEALVRFIEAEMEGARCSILLARDGTLRHGAAPSLPAAYNEAIDGIAIGPAVGSCGTAAFRGEPVIAADIMTDPLWVEFRNLAREHGLRACWSTPVYAADGQLLGTFAVYHGEVHHPTPREQGIVETLSYLAGIAIGRARSEEQRTSLLVRERAAREAAESAVRARDQFLSIAAHELRTPVTAIKGTAQLTLRAHERGTLDLPRSEKALRSIHQTVDHLAALIDDLLDVSRIRGGQLALRPERIDLITLVEDTVERYNQQIDGDTSVDVTTPTSPIFIAADHGRLEQVLNNLISNAVKYSPNGGAIRVTVASGAAGVEIAVTDQGIGLPNEDVERIFEPFGRAGNATALHIRGLGLGLHVSRQIINLHGGRVWAESAGVNQGTTMHIWLPYEPSAVNDQSAALG